MFIHFRYASVDKGLALYSIESRAVDIFRGFLYLNVVVWILSGEYKVFLTSFVTDTF